MIIFFCIYLLVINIDSSYFNVSININVILASQNEFGVMSPLYFLKNFTKKLVLFRLYIWLDVPLGEMNFKN